MYSEPAVAIVSKMPNEGLPRVCFRYGRPYQRPMRWTHRESNPDCQSAELESSRWTMSPCCRVDRRGLEPRSPGCKPGVLPLDEQPAFQRSVRELNPTLVLTKDVCCHNTYRPSSSVIPAGIEPSHPLDVIQASPPLDYGIMFQVTEAGVEPADAQDLDLFALPVCVPGHIQVAGPGVAPGNPGL